MDVNGKSDEKCLEASPLTLPGDLDLRSKLAQVFPDRIQKLLQRCFTGGMEVQSICVKDRDLKSIFGTAGSLGLILKM